MSEMKRYRYETHYNGYAVYDIKISNVVAMALIPHLDSVQRIVDALNGDNIKPLNWKFFAVEHEHGTGAWDANGVNSTYEILDCGDKYGLEHRFYPRFVGRSFATLKDAQDAVWKYHCGLIRAKLVIS